MPGTKFWLSPEGKRYGREPMEQHHEDIGRRILHELGVRYDPRAEDDVYVALFKLNYLRVVEYAEMHGVYVENDGLHEMTRKQREYLDDRRFELGGAGSPWTVHFNDRLFMETRQRVSHADFVVQKLLE